MLPSLFVGPCPPELSEHNCVLWTLPWLLSTGGADIANSFEWWARRRILQLQVILIITVYIKYLFHTVCLLTQQNDQFANSEVETVVFPVRICLGQSFLC